MTQASSPHCRVYRFPNTTKCLFLLLVHYRQRFLTPLAGFATFALAPSKYNFTTRLIENYLISSYLAALWKSHKSTLVSLLPLTSEALNPLQRLH